MPSDAATNRNGSSARETYMTCGAQDPSQHLVSDPNTAELDRLPEYVFDERRNMLWELDDGGLYGLVASQDPMGYMRQSLSQLRGVLGSVLVPLRVDRRPREPLSCQLREETSAAPELEGGVGSTVDVDSLSAAVGEHLDRLGIERSEWLRVAKVGEEGGEVIGALIERGLGRADIDDVVAELGDVFLSALGALDQLGLRPSTVIAQRWKAVRRRSARVDAAGNGGQKP